MSFTVLLTIVQAILPILITVALGYLAAWRKDFDSHQAGVLIRLVMLYALPLALFTSILSTPRTAVLSAGPLALLIFLAMVVGYALVFTLCRWGLAQHQGAAALIAMTVTGPSVPFIGIPVLGQLFGPASAVPISIAALIMNLLQVPVTLILMSHDQNRLTQDEPPSATSWRKTLHELGEHLLHSCQEPVVWAPMLALILVLLGAHMPGFLKGSFLLLGHATGGTALFASGVVLFARKIQFNFFVGIMVAARNIIIPLIIYIVARSTHLPALTLQESVLTIAIPSAALNIILAIRYHILEREISSVLFFSTLSAIFTMASFIWLTS